MVSTGIYVRVSAEEQAKEGYSIRAQEEKLRAYATLKDWNIYMVYVDGSDKIGLNQQVLTAKGLR